MPGPVARVAIPEPFSQDRCGHVLQELLALGPGICVAVVTKELGSRGSALAFPLPFSLDHVHP